MKWLLLPIVVSLIAAAPLPSPAPTPSPATLYESQTGINAAFTSVPPGYKIFTSADFLEALQDQTKPTLTEGDYLWITKAPNGDRLFTAARPYGLATGKSVKAVILDVTDPALATPKYLARTTAKLDRTINANALAGRTTPYATVLSIDPKQGTLYQLGFPQLSWEDHKTIVEDRELVMHDPSHGWRFVASPYLERTLCGTPSDPTSITTRVTWTKDPTDPLRLDFKFTRTAALPNVPPLTTSVDMISLHLSQISTVARSYYELQPGDTLSALARHLAQFMTIDVPLDLNQRAALLLNALLKLNASMDPSRLAVGTRITIPTLDESLDLLHGKLKLAQLEPLPTFDLSYMTADTPEAAAMLAILLDDSDFNNAEMDIPATLASLKQQVVRLNKPNADFWAEQINLNADKTPEFVYNTSLTILRDGSEQDSSGATGNHCFAIVEKLKSGRGHLALTTMGTGPDPLDTRTNGWRDLQVGYNMGGGEANFEYYRYDGHTYRDTWGTGTINIDGTVPFRPMPVPDGLAAQAAALTKVAGPSTLADAATFSAQINNQSCILLSLDSIGGSPNLFPYRQTSTSYQLLMAVKNIGSIPFPEQEDTTGDLLFPIRTGGTDIAPQTTTTRVHLPK